MPPIFFAWAFMSGIFLNSCLTRLNPFDHPSYVVECDAAPIRDSLAAPMLSSSSSRSRGHGKDDRLHLAEFFVRDVEIAHRAHPWQHLEEPFKDPSSYHPHLLEVVAVGEVRLPDLLLELAALLFIECSFAFFTRLITSPMPRIRSAIERGLKICKSPIFSPTPSNLSGFFVTSRIEIAAPARALPSNIVRIGARDLDPLVELGRRLHCVLSRRRIGDEENLARLVKTPSSRQALA